MTLPEVRPEAPGAPARLRLDAGVGIRPERFGGLLYHFGTRRLSLVRDSTLALVLRRLQQGATVPVALAEAGVPTGEHARYEAALARLAESGFLVPADRPDRPGRPAGSAGGTAPSPARPSGSPSRRRPGASLADQLRPGLAAPICLTWELTYACNLACVHCLSSSGRRDRRELTTAQAKAVVDELESLGVFYVNIGGGEPTIRPDFREIVDYAVAHHVGVKFSTNGSRIDPPTAAWIAADDRIDVQLSIDGATAEVNDAVRGAGSFETAMRALRHLRSAGASGVKLSVVATRHNIDQLDALEALAAEHGAVLRVTRLRPSGRGVDSWHELHPTAEQQHRLHSWLSARGEAVLTGDSFFHLGPLGDPLPGLNLCGAGRVVCLIDPIGDVYACPFAIHESLRAGNVRHQGGFAGIWRDSAVFSSLRASTVQGSCASCQALEACGSGCLAAKLFTGLPLDGPDPECVLGHGEAPLAAVDRAALPQPAADHSRSRPVTVALDAPRRRAVQERCGG